MGHSVLVCDFCKSYVMEGHNDWECDCGAHCSASTRFTWVKVSALQKVKKEFENKKR
jgi:hypothetical protein